MKYLHLPYDNELKEKARGLRNNMTYAEKKLWYQFLRSHHFKFLRQKPIEHFIVDFYCQEARLIIEIDGESHLGDINEKYDKRRSDVLENLGLRVLRFWNKDVFNGFAAVCEEIDRWLEFSGVYKKGSLWD